MNASPTTRTGLGAFVEGLLAPLRGLAHMYRNPGLWRYAIAPVLLNLLTTLLVIGLLVIGLIWAIGSLHAEFSDGFWGSMMVTASVLGLVFLAIGTAIACWFALNAILCGYFYDKLARAVEIQLGMRAEDLAELPIWVEVVEALRDAGLLLVINLGLLVVHCVPVAGAIVYVVLVIYFDSYLLGREFLNYPLVLRAIRRKERRAIARRHRAHTLGLGLAVLGCTLIPVLGAVVLTTAVTGAVLLNRRFPPEEK